MEHGDVGVGLACVALVLALLGLVLPEAGELAFSELDGISITNPLMGQVLVYNGTAWVNGNLTVPAILRGTTKTFSLASPGVVNETVVFSVPFNSVPIVVVSLAEISNSSAVLVNVEAFEVSVTGFTARCVVYVAAEGSAKFNWVAVEA